MMASDHLDTMEFAGTRRRSHFATSFFGGNFASSDNLDVHEEFDIDDADHEQDDIESSLKGFAPPFEQFYHGRLDRHTAEERLQSAGQRGSYLVRESERKAQTYSLSFLGVTGINHFRINGICGDYYIGGRKFRSLENLVGYYASWGNIMKSEKLEFPVAPPEPVKMSNRVRAKFSYKGTPETDELSFAAGEVFVVDNVLDDWLWVKSIKDGASGIVPKALTESLHPSADKYEGRSWFYPVSKENAQLLLLSRGKVGDFLVRPSDKQQGDYSLSLRDHNSVSRFLIRKQGKHYMIGGRSYDCIDAIIDRYSKEHLAQGLSLGDPLDRTGIDTESLSNHGKVPSDATDGLAGLIPPLRLDSRGSDIITKKDRHFKSGYLVKKGNRNKWKRMYFTLNAEEQHLCYFENEKRTKPKGLLDLCFASVYKVHESLFGRPNSFQIVLRALDETTPCYLCTDTSDEAQEWMEAIIRLCGKQKGSKQCSFSNASQLKAVKQLRSLELSICDAHKLPQSKLPHPYCVVSLNDVKTCRTNPQEGPSPVWGEDFKFNDLPTDINAFTISIYNRNKRTKDAEIGRVTVPLCDLAKGEVLDQWFAISAVGSKTEIGSMRLKARYVHEIIMASEEYMKLKEVLLGNDYQTVAALGEVAQDLNALAFTLLRIFRQEKKEIDLIKTIAAREIELHEKKETFFRGNTLATKLIDQYMKMVAIPYLQQTIKDVVMRIMECKQSCELKPARLEKGANAVDNLQQLLKFLDEATDAIFKSAELCPRSLRYLFYCLQQSVQMKWPEEDLIRYRVVSAFLFLRLICPAILNPKICNLMNETISPMASRSLTLVAMCLQKLANLVEFGAKEPYLVAVNPFIQRYKPKMIEFLDEVSLIPDCPPSNDPITWDQARGLAAIHDICVTHEQQLQQLSLSQPNVKILLAISDGISTQKKLYMKETDQTNLTAESTNS